MTGKKAPICQLHAMEEALEKSSGQAVLATCRNEIGRFGTTGTVQEYIEKAKEKLVALFGKNERVLLGAKCRNLIGLSHNGSRVHEHLVQWNLAVSCHTTGAACTST